MSTTEYTLDEVAERGRAIYEQQIRSQVEADNRGRLLLVDVTTGRWEMGEDRMATARRLRVAFPAAEKIGAWPRALREEETVSAILDTGFSAYLVLPLSVISRLALPQIDVEEARLANGSVTRCAVHEVTVVWHDEERVVPAHAAEDVALLGVTMLRGSVTTLGFVDTDSVTIESG